jgi:hypothetical protein
VTGEEGPVGGGGKTLKCFFAYLGVACFVDCTLTSRLYEYHYLVGLPLTRGAHRDAGLYEHKVGPTKILCCERSAGPCPRDQCAEEQS